jgi:cyclophilin family peptidyl-prolyl cis-trans isomerase
LITLIYACLCAICAVSSTEDPVVTSRVHCTTTKGDLSIEIYRDWAPLGADRFIELVRDGFFQEIGLFRCVKRFLTQFGISDKPQYKHWHYKDIPDDPNLHKGIHKNYLSFAGGGPNTRSTQLFIAFEDLDFLGKEPWETPFGKVVDGQATLDNLYKEYGDIPPFGKGPDQQKIHNKGNAYLRENFPDLDYILSCRVVEEPQGAPEPKEEATIEAAAAEEINNNAQENSGDGGDIPVAEHEDIDVIPEEEKIGLLDQEWKTADQIEKDKVILEAKLEDDPSETMFHIKAKETGKNIRRKASGSSFFERELEYVEKEISFLDKTVAENEDVDGIIVICMCILGLMLFGLYGWFLQRKMVAASKKS